MRGSHIVTEGVDASMRLEELIVSLDGLDEDATICARRPWGAASDAILVHLHDGPIPPDVKQTGYAYFIDVATAREVMEVFGNRPPTEQEKLKLLLHYAENDAFPEWVYER